MYGSIIEAIHAFSDDPEVRCIVVTGEGVGFCTWGDVREGSGRRSAGSQPNLGERAENLARNAELVVVLHEAPRVTIAAVNGAADIATQIAEGNPIAMGTLRGDFWFLTLGGNARVIPRKNTRICREGHPFRSR